MSEATERWLVFAREDLRAAEVLLAEDIFNLACFHAQQSVEKALKGLLAQQGQLPPRVHTISELLTLLPSEQFADLSQSLLVLDDYYIPTRYPDTLPGTLPEGLPGRDQAVEALQLAQTVLQQVADVLQPTNKE